MANQPDKVIIERSGNTALISIIALIVLALLAVGIYAVVQNQNHKDDAISTAAEKVGDAAQDVGDAAKGK